MPLQNKSSNEMEAKNAGDMPAVTDKIIVVT